MEPTNRENWKSTDGSVNYEVSSFGRVRNATTDRILEGNLNSNGYLNVALYKNGKMKTHYIHKLVAQEWIENPDNKRCVDHINCNRTNRHRGNLGWATHSENTRNQKIRADTSSVYKGVCWDTNANKWKAQSRSMENHKTKELFKTSEKQQRRMTKRLQNMLVSSRN